jgi:hypothetical protein
MRFIGKCIQCSKLINRIISNKSPNPKFCSRFCKGIYQSIHFQGEHNPNFGKKWSNEQKIRQQLLVASKVDDEYRSKAGSANRGKKFDQDRICRMHDHRTKESYIRIHNNEVRSIIGQKSKEKFTEDFKISLRKINEERGNWIPFENKSDWEIYKKESNWISSMFDQIDNIDQIQLLSELKVFHSLNNKSGVVRDHRYSRHDGFKNRVFPEILRHPANCEIMTHNLNVKKGIKSTLTLDELFNIIENYDKHWKEQSICLNKISDYKKGKQWNRKEASE